jgi:hypothetical protein
MSDSRNPTSWLLLGLLTVVGVGGAVLGVAQSPKNVPLQQAVDNTLAAPNYSEVLTESTAQGKQTDYLTYQAPDRLGGYIQSGSKRTYVYVIGALEFQSLTVSANSPNPHLVFYKQSSQGAKALDPAHGYLPYARQGKNIQQSGGTYSFTLTKSGQTGKFGFTVSGQYISEFTLNVQSASVQLVISEVGTSLPVRLPAGSKVVAAPSGSAGNAG